MTSRTEYLRGVMDALSDPSIETVVMMFASQIGKTEVLNNLVGFHIDQDPAPILVIQPTLEMAHNWSKTRLAPMLRDTPSLRGKVKEPRTRDSANTVLHKLFPGGHISVVGANSPAGLASRPIRIVICDEVDRFDVSAGTEGDPISLAAQRSMTFWNRKLVLASTPTIKDASRIEVAFGQSDQRRYFVPCELCGHRQVLRWGQVKWEKDGAGESLPETAKYFCEACNEPWTNAQRLKAIGKGEWRASRASNGIAGFHVNAFVSPFVTIPQIVRRWLREKELPETLKAFVTLVLGESFEDYGKRMEDIPFLERREPYGGTVPAGVAVIVAGVDVQDDRLEVELVGFGRGEECWSLDYRVIRGDPSSAAPWRLLDDLLLRKRKRDDGIEFSVGAACIDTGGHHTQSAYAFCRERYARRVWAIKGSSLTSQPIWPRKPTRTNIGRVPLFMVGVHAAKDLAAARFRVDKAGPGYCHFPDDRGEEYFAQLTSEKVITHYKKGVAIREWRKITDHARNEAWDCRVYALCAFASLVSMSFDVEREAGRLEQLVAAMERQEPIATQARRRVRSAGIASVL